MYAAQAREHHYRLLDSGGCLVVVGGRSSNFPEAYRAHPQIVFLDSTDPDTKRNLEDSIPHNTKAIITTRFNSHAVQTPLLKLARKRHITMFNETGTGKIKQLIDQMLPTPIVDEAPAPPTWSATPSSPLTEVAAPLAVAPPPPPPRPEVPYRTQPLFTWVWENIEPRNIEFTNVKGEPRLRLGILPEVKRLMKLAQTVEGLTIRGGKPPSETNIKVAVGVVLSRMGIVAGKPLPGWAVGRHAPDAIAPAIDEVRAVVPPSELEVVPTPTAQDLAFKWIEQARELIKMSVENMQLVGMELESLKDRLSRAVTLEEKAAQVDVLRGRMKEVLEGV